jgi:hypothetical protein
LGFAARLEKSHSCANAFLRERTNFFILLRTARSTPSMNELPESLPHRVDDDIKRIAEYEAALDDALGDTPRASELRQLRDALTRRRQMIVADFNVAADPEEREQLRARLHELDEHISVLDEEARINKFVEDTITFSHEVRRLSEG